MASLAFELGEPLRVCRPETLVSLDNEREQKCGPRCLDHDICERQSLHDRVYGHRMMGNVGKIWCHTAYFVSDAEEEDVGGALEDDQAHNLVDRMATGHNPVQACACDPRHDGIEDLAQLPLFLTTSACSSSSATIMTKAAQTSTPTKKLMRAIVPEESTAPGCCPRGRRSVR